MVIFIYGTTGELIKILPLLRSIPPQDQFRISTEQQPQQLKGLHEEADTPEPNLRLANGHKGNDLEKITDIVWWFKDIVLSYRKVRREIKALKKRYPGKVLVMVHGDTVTTVIGAFFGRLQRLPVAHLEAGLRSGNWRHPFPEELDRRITTRLATKHFAPGDEPVGNLKASLAKGEIINTRYNTVLDSLREAQAQKKSIAGLESLPEKYFVVSLHRNELMSRPKDLKLILENIAAQSTGVPCVFLDHPVTKERIRALKLDYILESKNITRLQKLRYFQFITLMSQSDFIITDSGGLQEEAAYLGIPCLVHRLTTERQEGLGKNVILSLYEDKRVKEFLKDPEKYRTKGQASDFSPSAAVLEHLRADRYV